MASTFPAIAPIHAIEKSVQSVALPKAMGDGYEKNIRFGLNLHRPTWRVTWQLVKTDVDTIETFLSARAADGDAFLWIPPDSSNAYPEHGYQRWRCAEWETTQTAANWFTIDATFQQVYEPVSFTLTASPSFFSDDTLCETDWGIHDGRFFVIQSDRSGYSGLSDRASYSNTVVDKANNYYTAHNWPGAPALGLPVCRSVVVTKINENQSGTPQILWTRMFTNNTYTAETSATKSVRLHTFLDDEDYVWVIFATPVPDASQVVIHFIKLSPADGSLLLQKTALITSAPYGSLTGEIITKKAFFNDGHFYIGGDIVGAWQPTLATWWGFVMKISTDFTVKWANTFHGRKGSPEYSRAGAFLNDMELKNGIVHITGQGAAGNSWGSPLIRIDATTGVYINQAVLPVINGVVTTQAIITDKTGMSYIAAVHNNQLLLFKYNTSAVRQWVKKLSVTGTANNSTGTLLEVQLLNTSTGRMFVGVREANYSGSSFSSVYFYIIEFDQNGKELSVRRYKPYLNTANYELTDLYEPKYDRNGLLILCNNGDHACTTQDVELFDYTYRDITSVPTYTSTEVTCSDDTAYVTSPVFSWAPALQWVNSAYTVGTPSRSTLLFGIDQ